jgi:hypothetical protein
MRRVTISATNVVAPVFSPTEVISLFSSGMATQTSFRDLFGRFVFVGNDFGRIAFFDVGLARAMTGFATSHLILPTSHLGKLCV